jgi:LAS superfamily LD-carboxypeptidase LdcB
MILNKTNKTLIIIGLSIVISLGFTTQSTKFTKNELMGKVSPAKNTHFIKISTKYTTKSNIYLRKQCYESYKKMYDAAQKEGLKLNIISAFRSFYHQKSIWEAKWTGKRKVGGKDLSKTTADIFLRAKTILKYSSMPGSSRHHWGTDIDMYSLENSNFEKGTGLKIYKWLKAHASEYGFHQVYTAGRPFGYNEEKWHWSYLPIAKPMLEAFKKQISIEDFNSFKGSQTADSLQIIKHYVLGINEVCL